MSSKREWLIGRQGHTGMLTIDELAGLIRAGQLRADEMVKRQGQPWRAAREVPELASYFGGPVSGGPFIPEERTIMFPSSPAAATAPLPPPVVEPAAPTGRFSEPTPPPTPAVTKRDPDPAPIVEPPKKPAPDPVPTAAAVAKPAPSVYDPAPPVASASPSPVRQGTPMGERGASDFVGDVALAFSGRQLAAMFGLLLVTFTISSLLFTMWGRWVWDSPKVRWVLDCFPWSILGAGVILAFAVAVCMTRRQMEPGSKGTLGTDVVRIGPALLTIAIGTVAVYAIAWGGLWVLGWFRNLGAGSAVIMRFLQIVPLLVAALAVGGVLAGALAIAYAAAASVVEGCGAGEAFGKVRAIARNAGRRLATHAFGIAGAVTVAATVCGGVVGYIWMLIHDPEPSTAEVAAHWQGHWVIGAFYDLRAGGGLPMALSAALPVSLGATLAVISYLSLRRYAEEAGK